MSKSRVKNVLSNISQSYIFIISSTGLTLVFASILDPLSSSNLTMLLLPLFAAT